MKPIFLITITFIISVFLTSCADDAPTSCGQPVCVEYHDKTVDVSNEFVSGKLCVGTNTDAFYSVQQNLFPDLLISNRSAPQEQVNVTNCRDESPGTYIVTFRDKTGYRTPPTTNDIEIIKGRKAVVYGYYGNP